MMPVVLQACNPGERIAMRHARILVHHVRLSSDPTIDDLKDQNEHLEIMASLEEKQGMINKILLSRSRISPEDLDALCKRDEYIPVEKALDLGFIDKIED